MKTFYSFIAILLVSFVAFALPYKINIDSTGISFSVPDKPAEKKSNLPEKIKPRPKPERKVNVITPFLPPSISVTKSVTVNGGGNALPGSQLNYSILLSNGGTDATAVVLTDVLNSNLTLVAGSVKASPIAVADVYTSIGNVGISVPAASGVITNDVNPIAANTITITTFDATSVGGGAVTMTTSGANIGAFTYTPAAGYSGNDTFTYSIDNGSGITNAARTATVTVSVSSPIYFVNRAAVSNGNGTLESPFKEVSNITGTGSNSIFIYSNAGNYTGSLTLAASQKLIGQGATSSIASIVGITLPPFSNALPATGGTNPVLANATTTLTLNTNNDVQGITIANTGGTAITGSSVGALKVRDVTVSNTAGQALQIGSGGALDCIFSSISSAGANKGVSVNNSTGSFQVSGVGSTVGTGGTISSIAVRGVEFTNTSNVTLKNMNFTNANTTAGSTPTQTSNSGANAALYFNAVAGITLDNIQMNAAVGNANAQNGINLFNCSNFNLANSTITRSGFSNSDYACLYAINTTGTNTISNSTLSKAARIARFTNNSGTMTLRITGSSFNDTRTNPDNNTLNAFGQAGLLFEGYGTSQMTLDVKSLCNFLRCATQGIDAYANENSTVRADVQSSSFDATNNSLPTGEDVGTGTDFAAYGNGVLKFNILNNTITGRASNLINLYTAPASAANVEGVVDGNTLTYNFKPTVNNNAGSGIRLNHNSTNIATRVRINNNTLRNFGGGSTPIDVLVNGTVGRADIICTNNTIIMGTASYGPVNELPASYGIRISAAAQLDQTVTVCSKTADNLIYNDLNLGNNFGGGVGGLAQFRAANRGNIHLFEGNNAGNTTPIGMLNIWNNAGNLPTATGALGGGGNVLSVGGNGTFTYGATCATPNAPLVNLSVVDAELAVNQPTPNARIAAKQAELTTASDSVAVNNSLVAETDEWQSLATEKATQNSVVSTQAGETITVDGAGSGFNLPANKSTTVTFSATISSTPSTCAITNQASVSGTGFTTTNSNTTTTNVIIAPPTNLSTATTICAEQSVSLSATCTAGTVNWYTTAAPSTLLGTTVSGGNFVQSPTVTTTYTAKCLIGGCESVGTNSGLITVNPLPILTAGASVNPTACLGTDGSIPFTTTNLPDGTYSLTYTGAGSPQTVTVTANAFTLTGLTAGDYSNFSITNAGCVGTDASTQTLVNPTVPTLTAGTTTNPSTCSGTDGSIPFTTNLLDGNYTLGYSKDGTATTESITVVSGEFTLSNLSAGTYSDFSVTVLGCAGIEATPVTLSDPATPVVTASFDEPTCEGQNLQLRATVTGVTGTILYNWSGPGGFTSTLANPLVTNPLEGEYTVDVSAAGCTAMSTTSTVVIVPPISFERRTTANFNEVFGCEGGSVKLGVGAVSIPSLTYQWQIKNGATFENLANNPPYSNVTADSLVIDPIALILDNQQYRVLLSTACQSNLVSDTVTLRVGQLPVLVTSPLTQQVCPNNEVQLTADFTGGGFYYQWQVNTGSGFVNVSGSDYQLLNNKLIISNFDNAKNNYQYRAVAKSSCFEIPSNAATITINTDVTILAQPNSQTVCEFNTAIFTAQAVKLSAGTLTYQWQRKSGSEWVNVNTGGRYVVNGNQLTINNAPASWNGAEFRCLINGYCQTIPKTLFVTPVAHITQNPQDVEICTGNNATFSVTAAGQGLKYRWQVNTGSGFTNLNDGGVYQGVTSANLLLSFPNSSLNNYQYRCIVSGNSSCDLVADTSVVATISIGVSAEAQTVLYNSPITTNDGVTQAVGYILGINKIQQPDGKAEYRAGNAILLNPGFEVEKGAVFKAIIRNPCQLNLVNSNDPKLPKEKVK